MPAGGGPATTIVRTALISLGVLAIVLGAWVLQDTVSTKQIWGLVSWLILAVIIHDGILSPVVAAISIAMRRAGHRIPPAVLAILQGGVVVGAVFTLIVVPEIVRKAKGPKNYTVTPLDYGLHLALLWAAVAVVTAIVVVVYLRVTRARRR
ncbi:hypothetical protein AX769_08125 [Frondihabitans sp. PAMC 28766]|nr:hypothetical protein AX769_08125 [Frondihabitans sp. PAMC 28766]